MTQEELKENMVVKLSAKRREVLLSWLNDEHFLTNSGHKYIRKIVARGFYNEGSEKKELNRIRKQWVEYKGKNNLTL